MFAGIYRDFAGKSECGDFKFTGIACIPAIPVIFEVNQKKVWTFYIYTLLRFFKFPYNFCGDFRRTCNPRDNYMHFTGYVLRHGDPPHFLWGKNLQCIFDRYYIGQIYGGDFAKFCGLLRIYELYIFRLSKGKNIGM